MADQKLLDRLLREHEAVGRFLNATKGSDEETDAVVDLSGDYFMVSRELGEEEELLEESGLD